MPAPRFDYHLHPGYSIDATGTVADFCEAALARGLTEICLTTHYDANPAHAAEDAWVSVDGQIRPLTYPWLPLYLDEIDSARRAFAPRGLEVRAGLEVDYFPGAEDILRETLTAAPLDFVLGSVHRVEGHPFADRLGVEGCFECFGVGEALVRYYQLVARAARSGLFDCIGHLDLYRRSAGLSDEGQLKLPGVGDAVEGALSALKTAGVGLELNTRGTYRPGAAGVSPGPALLGLAVRAGLPFVTIGSDAHQPGDVGRGLDPAVAIAKAAGVSKQCTFLCRKKQEHLL